MPGRAGAVPGGLRSNPRALPPPVLPPPPQFATEQDDMPANQIAQVMIFYNFTIVFQSPGLEPYHNRNLRVNIKRSERATLSSYTQALGSFLTMVILIGEVKDDIHQSGTFVFQPQLSAAKQLR